MRGTVDADGEALDYDVAAVDRGGQDESINFDREKAREGRGFAEEGEGYVHFLSAVLEEGRGAICRLGNQGP